MRCIICGKQLAGVRVLLVLEGMRIGSEFKATDKRGLMCFEHGKGSAGEEFERQLTENLGDDEARAEVLSSILESEECTADLLEKCIEDKGLMRRFLNSSGIVEKIFEEPDLVG